LVRFLVFAVRTMDQHGTGPMDDETPAEHAAQPPAWPPPEWLPLPLWMRTYRVTPDQLVLGERAGFRLPAREVAPGMLAVHTASGFDWLALLTLDGIRPQRPAPAAAADPTLVPEL
jgi:hypothetical protein